MINRLKVTSFGDPQHQETTATPRNHPAFSPNSGTELLYTQAKKPEKLLTITSSRCLYTRSTLNLTNQPPHLNNNDKKTLMIISTCVISPISKNIRITQNMSDKGCCRLISIGLPSFSCWFRTSCEIWYPFYNEPLEFIVKCGCINAWKKKMDLMTRILRMIRLLFSSFH